MNSAVAVAELDEDFPPDLMLERMRRDPAVTNAAFRLAHAIATRSKNGMSRATLTQLAASCGTTAPTASHSLDRLAGLGYVSVRRHGPGAPIEIRLLRKQAVKLRLA